MSALVSQSTTEEFSTHSELLAQASAAGLVSEREVLDGSVQVRNTTGHRMLHALLVGDHAIAYAKHYGAAAPGEETIGRERAALAWLRNLDLGPRLLRADAPDTLWVGAVGGTELAEQRGTMAQLAEICQAWGTALARLHRADTNPGGRVVAPRPWPLQPHRLPQAMHRLPIGSAREMVRRAATEDHLLTRSAAAVADRWSEQCLIHGELSARNVLVTTAPDLRVRFVDFERAGLGDPGWDLAGAVDVLAGLAASDSAWAWRRLPAETLTEELLRGYRRAGGSGHLDPSMRAVRALTTAWQIATTETSLDAVAVRADVATWLRRARDWAARAGRVGLAA